MSETADFEQPGAKERPLGMEAADKLKMLGELVLQPDILVLVRNSPETPELGAILDGLSFITEGLVAANESVRQPTGDVPLTEMSLDRLYRLNEVVRAEREVPITVRAISMLQQLLQVPMPADLTESQVKRYMNKVLDLVPSVRPQKWPHTLISLKDQYRMCIEGVPDPVIDERYNEGKRRAPQIRSRIARAFDEQGRLPELRALFKQYLTEHQLETWEKSLAYKGPEKRS